jgi:hypothetical protein
MNKDIMVLSNSIQLRKILSEYIEMSTFAVKHIDDSDIDIGVEKSIPNVEDAMIDFIILMKSKKIYRFADTIKMNSHSIRFLGNIPRSNLMDLYDTALDINTLIGNLEITSIPLYYGTYTVAGYASSSSKTQPGLITDSSGTRSLLQNPSGIVLDSLGNIFFSDTLNHRICKLDGSGNLSTYAGSTTGASGFVNGSNTEARFNSPTALAVDR